MEIFRLKKSKKASCDDGTSGLRFTFSTADPQQGNKQTQKHRYTPKLASDFQGDDQLTFELGHNSSKQVFGTPIKKLLAEEMVKETESKKQSPSIIARLMGLDGLPTQQPVHKQKKGFPGNSRQRTAPIESHRNAISYDSHHHRNSSQEFKDVFEVIMTPKVDSICVPLQRAESERYNKSKNEYIGQKFIYAKRLSTVEKLQDSKEFHDALEVLDSDKDLLQKFLQEPDSLFTNHSPPQTRCANIAVKRSEDAMKCEKKVRGSKSGRETPWKGERRSQKDPDDLLSQSYSRHGVHKSKVKPEGKDGTHILPTRIVVLKPNIGKSKDVMESVSSPHCSTYFQSDYIKHMEFPSIREREADLWVKENLSNDLRPSRYNSNESGVNSKEITGIMRNGYMSPSDKRGYAGDESSSSMSENGSVDESDAVTSTSRLCDCDNHYGFSSSHSAESSVDREAKKRLSEGCKMTRRFLDVGVVNRGCTLGEMLSNTDREVLKENLNAIIGQEDLNSNSKAVGLIDPLGISSRDGWKDECISNLTRSRSLAVPSAAFGSPLQSMQQEAIGVDRHMMQNEHIDWGRNEAVQMNFNQRDCVSCRDLTSGNEKSRCPHLASGDINGTLPDVYYRQNQVESYFDDKGSAEQKPMVSDTSVGIVTESGPTLDDITDARNENMALSSEDNLLQEALDDMIVIVNSLSGVDDSLPQGPPIEQSELDLVTLLCPVPESESPASYKEIDQPSPVSVLEVPFVEDPSSSCECLERVGADIQGLQKQLQLLKLGSGSYAEDPMLIPGDEDYRVSEKKGLQAQESWQSSYLVDVLNHLSFDDTDPDMFMVACDHSECPIGPCVYEELENKYCNQSTRLRCERKLLFDRISSGLNEILRLFMNPNPQVKQATRKIHPKWDRVEVEDELRRLLAWEEEKQASDIDIAEKILEKESRWLNLGDDIGVVGEEIERSLIDELVTEVVTM